MFAALPWPDDGNGGARGRVEGLAAEFETVTVGAVELASGQLAVEVPRSR
jgi:hypothetical protein